MGRDKAFLELGAETAVERLVRHCREAGCDAVRVVRQSGAEPLPVTLRDLQRVEVDSEEMIVSLRAGLAELLCDGLCGVLVAPIDYAMVSAKALGAVVQELRSAAAEPGTRVVLPLCRQRPGHPIGLTAGILDELQHAADLREIVRRDPGRNRAVAVDDGWVLRDLDTPEDLSAAQGALRCAGMTATELMARHRSRRSYLPLGVGDAQLRWLVDSARHASTSAFLQACAVVAVRDPERKAAAARLCADQRQIHEAPMFLAVCADLHKVAAACRAHGGALDPSHLELLVEATVDAALFGQNLALAAESEGLGICMIGAARNHPVELARLLDLPEHVYVVFGMTVGWPADDPLPRQRMPLAAVLHDERYHHEDTSAWLEAADGRMQDWARAMNERDAGSDAKPIDETRGWTDRMWWLCGRGQPPKGRAGLPDELRELGIYTPPPRPAEEGGR